MVLQNIVTAPWASSVTVFEVHGAVCCGSGGLISGAFVRHLIFTEFCVIIIQWFTLCSQNTHSYLLRGYRDTVRRLEVVGWVGVGWGGDRQREARFLSPSSIRSDFRLFFSTGSQRASRLQALLDPEYSDWWHFTMCGWRGSSETGESVWSIDHCCCCPHLLCLIAADNSGDKRGGWRQEGHLFKRRVPKWD